MANQKNKQQGVRVRIKQGCTTYIPASYHDNYDDWMKYIREENNRTYNRQNQ